MGAPTRSNLTIRAMWNPRSKRWDVVGTWNPMDGRRPIVQRVKVESTVALDETMSLCVLRAVRDELERALPFG